MEVGERNGELLLNRYIISVLQDKNNSGGWLHNVVKYVTLKNG